MVTICKKCNTEVSQNYCPYCGCPQKLKRLDSRYIFTEIGSVLNFQKGILFTIRELLIRPRQSIRAFISQDRNYLVKPIMFILITSLVYTLLVRIFHLEDGYMSYSSDKESVTLAIFKWIQENQGYANIVMAIFIGLWLKIFFRKYPFNLFEILILLCYVMGIAMLGYSVFGVIQALTHANLMLVGAIAVLIYSTYALGQFFDSKKIAAYIKAFFAYLLGMITFSMVAVGVGITVELIIQR